MRSEMEKDSLAFSAIGPPDVQTSMLSRGAVDTGHGGGAIPGKEGHSLWVHQSLHRGHRGVNGGPVPLSVPPLNRGNRVKPRDKPPATVKISQSTGFRPAGHS